MPKRRQVLGKHRVASAGTGLAAVIVDYANFRRADISCCFMDHGLLVLE
jgi:hypothetical protein